MGQLYKKKALSALTDYHLDHTTALLYTILTDGEIARNLRYNDISDIL